MPLNGRDAAVLCVLVFCVPLQHWLTQRSVVSPTERNMEVLKVINEARLFYENHLSFSAWREWIISMGKKYLFGIKDYSHWYSLDMNDPEGVCPAVEVLILRNPGGTFGLSPKPRNFRPNSLKLRVGQVVKHKRWNYHGVIIGWDQKCKAPESWIKKMHGDHEEWRSQPNYAILVDTRDRREPQITYVPQENVYPVKNTKIDHPDLEEYFENFDGSQYVLQKWLQAIYPLN